MKYLIGAILVLFLAIMLEITAFAKEKLKKKPVQKSKIVCIGGS